MSHGSCTGTGMASAGGCGLWAVQSRWIGHPRWLRSRSDTLLGDLRLAGRRSGELRSVWTGVRHGRSLRGRRLYVRGWTVRLWRFVRGSGDRSSPLRMVRERLRCGQVRRSAVFRGHRWSGDWRRGGDGRERDRRAHRQWRRSPFGWHEYGRDGHGWAAHRRCQRGRQCDWRRQHGREWNRRRSGWRQWRQCDRRSAERRHSNWWRECRWFGRSGYGWNWRPRDGRFAHV